MKAVILAGEQPNQVALIHKLMRHCEVVAAVFSKNIPKKQKPLHERMAIFRNRVAGRFIGRPFVAAWHNLQDSYARSFPMPSIPTVHVQNVNDQATIDTVARYDPDLVIVSGTNMVGRTIIEQASKRRGIVNLHTGISPYVKGGPSCTNWCLAEGWFHLIGNTVMWLNLGIDTGPLIATERTPLDGKETLSQLHWKVMEHAHDLYCRAVSALASGRRLAGTSQDSLGRGRTFYTAEWNGQAMLKALARFHLRFKSGYWGSEEFRCSSAAVQLVPLED